MTQQPKPTIMLSARFPVHEVEMIESACKQLEISKTDLIIAGTIAEVRRRLSLEENVTADGVDAVLVQ